PPPSTRPAGCLTPSRPGNPARTSPSASVCRSSPIRPANPVRKGWSVGCRIEPAPYWPRPPAAPFPPLHYLPAHMADLESLRPDQRAVIQLLVEQGKSYEEIAGLLRIGVDGVRRRAHDALAALAPEGGLRLEPARRAELSDYLLG